MTLILNHFNLSNQRKFLTSSYLKPAAIGTIVTLFQLLQGTLWLYVESAYWDLNAKPMLLHA